MNRRNILKLLSAAIIAADPVDLSRSETVGQSLGPTRILRVGTEGGGAVGFKTYPTSLPLAEREFVLSFDDGPAAGLTGHVLDILADEHVKASFFLIGRNAMAQPELVRRIAREGHTVGTHSNTHPMTLRDLPEDRAKRDIEAGMAAVELALHGAGDNAVRRFFRYPGFGDSAALNAYLFQRNIVVFGADLWASDWVTMTPEAELALLMARVRARGRGIILLHDPRAQTVAMLPRFLRALEAEGYRIVHMVPGSGRLETVPAPAGWRSETERTMERRGTVSRSGE